MAKMTFTPEENKMLNKAWFLSWSTNMASSRVSQQSKCFAMTMTPALDLFYGDDEESKKNVFARHALEFFNTHNVMLSLVAGIAIALEKKNAEDKENDIGDTISTLKASLMGPTAGIGDSLFFNVFRVIIAGIAIGMASEGSILGVLFFMIFYGGGLYLFKWFAIRAGYFYGEELISKAYSTGIIPLITEAAGILGAIMVGALVAANVNLKIALQPNINNAVVDLQGILDSIMPGLLGLLVFFWCFSRVQKGWSILKVTWFLLFGGIILAFLGIV